jgi:hypothetical protein
VRETFRKKLNGIKSLEERAALKELIENVLLPMAEYQEEKWEGIKARVFDEAKIREERLQIIMGLCDREGYDPAHSWLSPILPWEEPNLSAISEALSLSEPVELFSVYLDEKFENLRDIFSAGRSYDTELRTDDGVVRASCRLVPDTRYTDALKNVYKSFILHGLAWETVQTAYLDRMARVVLTDWDMPGEGEALKEININFENSAVRHDRIPLWNIEVLSCKGKGFALAFEDEQLYEHHISLPDAGSDYLAAVHSSIRSVKKMPFELRVKTDVAKPTMWNIYRIARPQNLAMDKNPSFPLFSNARAENFVAFAADGTGVFTTAEILRRIESFALPLTVNGIRITDEEHPGEIRGTMNFALDDTFSRINAAKALVVSFNVGNAGEYAPYTSDMVCFLMSELQMKYPQYRCAGIIE